MLAVAAFTASCSSGSSADPATTAAAVTTTSVVAAPVTAPVNSAAAAGELPATVAVQIQEFAFGPAEVHVAVGGTVTWTNGDDQQHTATASGTFDTGAIQPGSSASATFDTAGTVAYICSFHPFMKGTVVVGS